jgi:hypothetical protein
MSAGAFTKLCSSLVTSTIWQESKETKILWITMLAMADRRGIVEGSIPGLAKMAGLTIPEVEAALEDLYAPDPYSRTKDNEGRRIFTIEGGWAIYNYPKYREMKDYDKILEQGRLRQQKYRDTHASDGKNVTDSNASVTVSNESASASASVSLVPEVPEGESEGGKRIPTLVEWLAEAAARHPDWPATDATNSWNYYESLGWKRGKTPVTKWKLCIATCYHNWTKFHPAAQVRPDFRREVPAG